MPRREAVPEAAGSLSRDRQHARGQGACETGPGRNVSLVLSFAPPHLMTYLLLITIL
jgi:hypothetical protein